VPEPPRIGVFGGTFDPIHNAHLDIARAALAQAKLDRVLFVVSARPPHKLDATIASPEDRYAMVEAALAAEPRMAPSRVELDRGGPSYTVDTLAAIQQEYPDTRLFLILGLDSLVDIPKWRRPKELLARARLLAVPRPGEWPVPKTLEGHYDVLRFAETDLSSTDVRKRIIGGETVDGIVPEAALRVIRSRGIYRAVARQR
jgi:nicotinate-nucleotide adenylyltransferase